MSEIRPDYEHITVDVDLAKECFDNTVDASGGNRDIPRELDGHETPQRSCRGDAEIGQTYQGPHNWRKCLKPVKSPIKADSDNPLAAGHSADGQDNGEGVSRSRPLPPWKRDLIERNKKVARLVRRESSGRSKRTQIVRRESSGRSKKSLGSESPSGIGRRRSFRNNSMDSAFTQQVVNENSSGIRRRISPHNSFKNSSGVRRTPSDKVLDPNDPATKKRVERVRRARLYLLQQMGPNSFLIVGDSPEHKFKVIIGPQTCTCGKGPHCVHVLFVMLRVFQVSESDSCLWSRQLKNYEVENLFRIYNDKRTLRIEAKKLRRSGKTSSNSSRVPSPEEVVVPADSDAGSVREEDDTCPICLLEMVEGESLLKCAACQNKLHHHCITVWFEECKRQKDPLICPLCRSRWKQTSTTTTGVPDEGVTEPPLVPPNTRVPSPHPEQDSTRLPYAEPIPGEYISLATPWIEILGEDLVSCLFSRNWSIRETGLKHLGCEMTRELGIITRDDNSGNSLNMEETLVKLLGCCFNVIAFMCQDPVYKVFVACLKVLRTVFSVVPSCDYHQRNKLQTLFKPVVDSIIVKCTDGNRRTGELSISTMLELAKGQHGELALGHGIVNPGYLGLGGIPYLVACLTEKYNPSEITWQWLLGRLYIVERFVKDFPTEFLPRQRPDGASSDGSLELIGATSKEDEERPQNYDRLLTVAEFAVKAVSNQHARISRVAKRVFLLAARYGAHLESLVTEFFNLISDLDFAYKKSLNRQLEKIVTDSQLLEQLGRQLEVKNMVNRNCSTVDSPDFTPLSTPKCTSPVTVLSDIPSESSSIQLLSKHQQILVPPNTPIRDRRLPQSPKHSDSIDGQSHYDHGDENEDLVENYRELNTPRQDRRLQQSLKHSDSVDCQSHYDQGEEKDDSGEFYGKLKPSKSLDDLDHVDCKPRRRLSKSPVVRKVTSRSRSHTPQRIGPVLETNLDEVILLEEEAKHRGNNVGQINEGNCVFDDDDDDVRDILNVIDPPKVLQTLSPLPHTHQSRLLSHDLETDIDSVELDLGSLMQKTLHSQASLLDGNSNVLKKCDDDNELPTEGLGSTNETPKVKLAKDPKSLCLDLDSPTNSRKSNRSISPCAHVLELERISHKITVDETPCQNSISQSKSTSSVKSIPKSDEDCESDKTSEASSRSNYCSGSSMISVNVSANHRQGRPSGASEEKVDSDLNIDYLAMTPCSGTERPVTFKTEVAMATPKHSPSHTLDRDDDDCPCKEEVEREEALALAKAMEVSSIDPPKPVVPGLTPLGQEEVITIRIQPENCDDTDCNGNPPTLYYENVHWMKGPLLGTGAFSTCYQARDIQTGTIMALKQISFCRNSRSEQESVIETITEEILMMAKLSHPHIVRILGATKQGCHFNMFVEWMPGGSVSYLLGQYGKFSEEVMTNYVLQVLRGLAYLHDNHILHRDLKGANLLVDSTGQRLRIGDFGAAARLASKATGAGEFQGQLLGTIAFMAPEVLRGENYGRACDVWSVGCCLIEMATTKPPWNAHDISNHLALIFKIANAQSTPPIPDKLSPPLRDLLLRCLEPVKDQRPSTKELLIHPLFTQYMQARR